MVRMLYLVFDRFTGCMALLARSAAWNNAELLVLGDEAAVLRRQNPRAEAGLDRPRSHRRRGPAASRAADEAADDTGHPAALAPAAGCSRRTLRPGRRVDLAACHAEQHGGDAHQGEGSGTEHGSLLLR
jgi:hypothetical protein